MAHAESLNLIVEIESGGIIISGVPLPDLVEAIPSGAIRAVVAELFDRLSDGGTEIASEFVGEQDLPEEIEEAIARLRRGEVAEALILLERAFYPSVSHANEAAVRRRAGEVRS